MSCVEEQTIISVIMYCCPFICGRSPFTGDRRWTCRLVCHRVDSACINGCRGEYGSHHVLAKAETNGTKSEIGTGEKGPIASISVNTLNTRLHTRIMKVRRLLGILRIDHVL